VLLSHAVDDATEATWPRRDVDVESCWRQWCQVVLATMLPSHAEDDAATQCCTGCGKVAQPPSSEHEGVVAS
jgi:hypothetical protein